MNKPNKSFGARVADKLLALEFSPQDDVSREDMCGECGRARSEDHLSGCETKALCDVIRAEREDCICVDSKSPTWDEQKRECSVHGFDIL